MQMQANEEQEMICNIDECSSHFEEDLSGDAASAALEEMNRLLEGQTKSTPSKYFKMISESVEEYTISQESSAL